MKSDKRSKLTALTSEEEKQHSIFFTADGAISSPIRRLRLRARLKTKDRVGNT